jgi:hypothetical protein
MEDFGDYKIIKNAINLDQIKFLLEYWDSVTCDVDTNFNKWDKSSTTKTKITSTNRNVEIMAIQKNQFEFLTDIFNNCFSEVMSNFVLEFPHHFTYYPLGGKHLPHHDAFGDYNREWIVSLMLNDNFEGGELVINKNVTPKEQGMAIIFKANLIHEVKPVTSGERFVITECAGK